MNSEDMKTSPTIETVLERINELAQQLTEVRDIVVELRDGQEGLKADLALLTAGFKNTDRKISVLNDSILSVNADQRGLESRVEALESK